jgi:uncharacterized protein
LAEENKSIVVNSGPLIALTHAGVVGLLSSLPFRFISTLHVRQELDRTDGDGKVAVPSDIVSFEDLDGDLDTSLVDALDPGEASVIQFARERNINTVSIDERRGRRVARQIGLQVIGSLGLLRRMKQERHLSSIRPALDKMLDAGYFVSDDLIEQVLRDAGEWNKP